MEIKFHHFSYDREADKEMGTASMIEKILGQAMDNPGQLEKQGQYTRLMLRLKLHDPMAHQNFFRMPPELLQELEQKLTPELQEERT